MGKLDLEGIDWVIVGGESGPGARPMKPEWVREVRDQCEHNGVAFFFKQWGGLRPKSGSPWPGWRRVLGFVIVAIG
jgi:protein gp37